MSTTPHSQIPQPQNCTIVSDDQSNTKPEPIGVYNKPLLKRKDETEAQFERRKRKSLTSKERYAKAQAGSSGRKKRVLKDPQARLRKKLRRLGETRREILVEKDPGILSEKKKIVSDIQNELYITGSLCRSCGWLKNFSTDDLIKRLLAEVKTLKTEIARLYKLFDEREERMNSTISAVLEIIQKSPLIIKPSILKSSFILSSSSPDEIKNIVNSKILYTSHQNKRKDILSQEFLDKKFFFSSTEKMVFVANPHANFDFVSHVHVDGKFLTIDKKYKQIFELVLYKRKDGKFQTQSIAFSLLSGSSVGDYTEFFQRVKDVYPSLKPSLFITDFELAIHNAIKLVFNANIQGCYFHYLNNIVRYKSVRERFSNSKVSKKCFDFLKILPFTKTPAKAIFCAIRSCQIFSAPDFKMLIYVFSTYVSRLRKTFLIDMSTNSVLTNNVCEGRNSGLAKTFGETPNTQSILEFVITKFKKELSVNEWKTEKTSDESQILRRLGDALNRNPSLFWKFFDGLRLDKEYEFLSKKHGFDTDKVSEIDAYGYLEDCWDKYQHYRRDKKKKCDQLIKGADFDEMTFVSFEEYLKGFEKSDATTCLEPDDSDCCSDDN